jgi:hypothetical protein
MDQLGGIDVLRRGDESNAMGFQALQPLMEVAEVTPEAMDFRNNNAIELVFARRSHQLFEGGQLVHGAGVTNVNIFGMYVPAAAADKPPHRPKLEGASRVSRGNASVQGATGPPGGLKSIAGQPLGLPGPANRSWATGARCGRSAQSLARSCAED